ncbi:high-affinity branched-chain amino acid ABC transporter permease LivM [Oceanibaculum pacificum]|uniref:Branched-chain amino acid ABC transporter permease n=1 Tax=Oceanibaculum pacificum TaxID=580166 RepID=A0A154W910_9PROT|nr:high-affinity branched-chain amino acid ABC transporter permease LivM [Oceanibaculum pacificum]KZD10019.1 branched-chain amino acid ABC transporter permease [Oceanibaculum pacificum]
MATHVRTAEGSLDLPAILKDCLMTGLVVFALAAPIIGLRTIDTPGGLGIDYRFDDVAFAVLAGIVGRFLLNLYWAYGGRRRPKAKTEEIAGGRAGAFMKKVGLYGGPAAILFAIAMPMLPFADRYTLDVAILVLTYIMLGWGLNIVVGLAGLLDLGYVAFYAVGAYSYALIAAHFDWSFWVCLPLAGLFAAFFGVILGFPVLRLRGDYLAIVTLGFGEIIRVVLLNWYEFTGGPDGVSGVPRPSLFGLEFARSSSDGPTFHQFFGLEFSSLHRIVFLYYVILALALITNFVTLRLRKLPIGRAWEALREDEIACRSLGINPTNTKLTAFAIGAMFGGFAGSFFATRQGFISPESFTFIESAVILAIVVLGGMGSQIGVVIAAIFLIGGTEVFRDLEQYRMLAFGGAMVLIMIWKPRGLLAHREPTLRLPPSRKPEAAPLAGGAS